MRFLAIVAAVASMPALVGSAAAQDWMLEPAGGSASLVLGSGSALDVDVTAGGNVNLGEMVGGRCLGRIAMAPDFRVVAEPGEGIAALRFSLASDIDTTLLVRAPGGAYLCDDDSAGGFDAAVVAYPAEAGQYDVWVGSYGRSGIGAAATLSIEALAEAPSQATLPARPVPGETQVAVRDVSEDSAVEEEPAEEPVEVVEEEIAEPAVEEEREPFVLQPPGGDGPYFFAEMGQAMGPVDLSEMATAINLGRVGMDTLVWHPGMTDWSRAETIPDLQDLLLNAFPPRPAPDSAAPDPVSPAPTGGKSMSEAARNEALMASCVALSRSMPDQLRPEECTCVVAELTGGLVGNDVLSAFLADFEGTANRLVTARDPIVDHLDRLCF